jgi:hypothetical protein
MDLLWFDPITQALSSGIRTLPVFGTFAGTGGGELTGAASAIGYTLLGVIITFILVWLRAKFIWFWLNPYGFILGMAGSWWSGLWSPLAAIFLRYLMFRVLGPKRAQELIVAAISGLTLGIGILYTLVGAYITFTTSIPNISMLWK